MEASNSKWQKPFIFTLLENVFILMDVQRATPQHLMGNIFFRYACKKMIYGYETV